MNADEYGTVRVGVEELCRNYAVYFSTLCTTF